MTSLKAARESRNLSVLELAPKLGTHPQNYYRIERGEQLPKRELARKIHEFFEGEVTLGGIYDPEYESRLAR